MRRKIFSDPADAQHNPPANPGPETHGKRACRVSTLDDAHGWGPYVEEPSSAEPIGHELESADELPRIYEGQQQHQQRPPPHLQHEALSSKPMKTKETPRVKASAHYEDKERTTTQARLGDAGKLKAPKSENAFKWGKHIQP